MMRVCHLNTCPVGVATQDPELRAALRRQAGVRHELLPLHRRGGPRVHGGAGLPHHGGDDRAGRPPGLQAGRSSTGRPRASTSPSILHRPGHAARGRPALRDGAGPRPGPRARPDHADPGLPGGDRARPSRWSSSLPIRNVNRTVGTMLGYEITTRWGGDGLPDDTITRPLPRLGRAVVRRLRAARGHLHARGRRQRLLGQGALGRQARRLPAPRGHLRARGEHRHRQRRPLRRDQRRGLRARAWPASASPCATAACTRSWRASATTAAST